MARVKRGVTGRARHKKVLGKAKGYYGRRKSSFRIANQAVEKAGQYAYRDRRNRKRDFRGLWIQRINAGVREHGQQEEEPGTPVRQESGQDVRVYRWTSERAKRRATRRRCGC